jgi:hypothetical protein
MQETTEQPTAEATEKPAESVESKPAEAVIEKPNSSKLLDFAKKEAEFARKEVARKQELEKWQSDYKKLEEEVSYFKSAKQSYKANPEALLEKLGITYEELTDAVIDYYETKDKQPKSLDPDTIRKEIEEQFTRKEQERVERERAAAVENFTKEIHEFVDGNKDKYPHLTQLYKPFGEAESPEEFIFGIIEEYYNETGEMIPLEEAAKNAEEYFREEWNKLNGVFSGKGVEVAPTETKTEKEVVATKSEVVENKPYENMSVSRFQIKDANTPNTITNNLAKPKSRVGYNPQKIERKDAIARAVEAMEQSARRAK